MTRMRDNAMIHIYTVILKTLNYHGCRTQRLDDELSVIEIFAERLETQENHVGLSHSTYTLLSEKDDPMHYNTDMSLRDITKISAISTHHYRHELIDSHYRYQIRARLHQLSYDDLYNDKLMSSSSRPQIADYIKNTKDKYYYEKEIAEAIAEIRLKYCNKNQEADANFNSQKKEVGNNMNIVAINQVLLATFIHKRQDVSRDCAALQQGRPLLQELSRVADSHDIRDQLSGKLLKT
ncbi:hypothetical protein Tco_0764663 [Tanacetum coccineum]